MKITTIHSPNQSERIHGQSAVRLIICHTPEGSYRSAIATCLDKAADVSYHLLVKKDGTEAVQMVPYDRKAWHAGAMNSVSEGIAIEGFARHFDLVDEGTLEMARAIASRLVVRLLPCQWTTDPAKGGICRHGDLQRDRTDPTPDLDEWRLFVQMVRVEYDRMTNPVWPRPIPMWFWAWMRWRRGVGEFKRFGPMKGPRPKSAPRVIPVWAWRRARAMNKEDRK